MGKQEVIMENPTEDYKNSEWEVYVADENGKEKIVKKAKSKRAGVILYNKLINSDKYHEVGMRVVKESVNENSKVYSIDVADMVDVLSSWDKGEAGYTDGNSYMGKKGKAEPFYYSQAGMHVSGGIKDALKALTKMWKKLDVKPATTIKIFKAYHKLPDSKKMFSNPDFWEDFLEKNGITVVAESVNESTKEITSFQEQFVRIGGKIN